MNERQEGKRDNAKLQLTICPPSLKMRSQFWEGTEGTLTASVAAERMAAPTALQAGDCQAEIWLEIILVFPRLFWFALA